MPGAGGPAAAAAPPTLVVFGVLYGATMGMFGGVRGQRVLEPLYSGVKVPMLLLVTFAVSLPSFLC